MSQDGDIIWVLGITFAALEGHSGALIGILNEADCFPE